MVRFLTALLVLAVLGALIFYMLTQPSAIVASALPNHTPDLENGQRMFIAGGCASCHSAPASKRCDDPKYSEGLKLGGGRCLKTPFGTFKVPNISPDKETGIGGWSNVDFVNAMTRGISPSGEHYYPAFPYTSYQYMQPKDLLDLKAYLDTLPLVSEPSQDHDLLFPFSFRRGLGLWKHLYLGEQPFVPNPDESDAVNRGAYLVRGPGHCGECHTPRDAFGGLDSARPLAGGPAPEGEGWIPNITPDKTGIGDWSKNDIIYALESGFTPDFDSFGGSMVAVQDNMAKLPASDREAIAAYLKSLPAIANAPAPKK